MHATTKILLKMVAISVLAGTLAACGGGTSSDNGLLPSRDNGNVTDNTNLPGGSADDTTTKNAIRAPRYYTAVVEWDIPTTRENGEDLDLSEIGGYELLYRKEGESLKPAIVIEDQTQDSFELTGLSAGRYEVMIAAFDTDGLYSDYSEPAYAEIGN